MLPKCEPAILFGMWRLVNNMDVKQAVEIARSYLQEVFGNELMSPPRLEEVWLDEDSGVWCLTFGFYRKPDDLTKVIGTFSTYSYKVVRVDDKTGKPLSIKDRERAAA